MTIHPDLAQREVALEKISKYLLNDRHPDGRSKAAYFRAFGFAEKRPRELQAALYSHPDRNPVADAKETLHGSNLIVRCTIGTPDARNPCVVSVWMIVAERPARLVTACPDP